MAALVEGVDVEVRLERDAQRVPRMGVPGEAVQQQERRAALPAPVEAAQPQAVDGQIAVDRPEEVHVWGKSSEPERMNQGWCVPPPRRVLDSRAARAAANAARGGTP